MYNTTDMSLNGLAGIDPAVCRQKCYDRYSQLLSFAVDAADKKNINQWYGECLANCGGGVINMPGGIVSKGGGASTVGAQNFLDNQALTVSAPKPLVSPARVNPTFSQIPAYSTQAVPFTAYGDNATYGTYSNPIRLGNTEPAVDSTPDIFKKENLTKTIGITAGILVVGYFAYKEFGGKKGTRRRR
jgi:hypothetical protein